jgi:AraC-like DNA-binding protein
MLTAMSDVEIRRSRVRTWLGLGPRFRAHLMIRARLLYDSRFCITTEPAPASANMYVVLRGSLAVDGGASSETPSIWTLADNEHEAVDKDSLKFRSWGDPLVALDLRFRASDLAIPIGLAHGPTPLDGALRERFESFVRVFDEGGAGEETSAAFVELVGAFAKAGVLTDDLPSALATPQPDPDRFTRLWRVVSELYMRHEVLPHLASMSDSAGLSYRQLDRDIAEFCRTYEVPGQSLRSAALYLRLRAAALYLSAPETSIGEVALRLGYGSAEAMARAFRDAGLPSPRCVRQAVLYPE